jgi:adhesin transport system outer membrane protein
MMRYARANPIGYAIPYAILCAVLCALLSNPARAGCDRPDPPLSLPPADAAAAQASLEALVHGAVRHSHAVGAARALAEASLRDVDEARAAALPQASVGASLGPSLGRRAGADASRALQGSASIGISQWLWDGGRIEARVDWRRTMSEAARLGQLSQQEQVALSAVSLALDRNRFRTHERVYAAYLDKMQCLVDALQAVVAADRGRASELLQARKSLQQADLARRQAATRREQVEAQLRRILGAELPETEALGEAWTPVPPLELVLRAAERSADIAQLGAQAEAAARQVRMASAETRPQLGWSLTGSRDLAWGGGSATVHGTHVGVGLTFSLPLWSPGAAPAADAARLRELAAREQLAEALQARRARVRELHALARATLERADQVQSLLADSDQLRQATLAQWQQLGRRSLFDVMAAEAEHYNLRVSWIDARLDAQQLGATLQSIGPGLARSSP